ncbi:glycosyl hydrolase family 47-domain-containing protein [Cladorrhinum samala]|uniref:alpha-1,2-Mannosidase n=1 Tax=Cladorrhinum samala TaxID=585594 RepID=A0AAV9HK49_9PEZI|nr:glycosyl hydrolase family 47-domain-containing protein [Cladorrhinum samala]
MLRLRRYRVFLICAFIGIALLYHISKTSKWEHQKEIWHSKVDSQIETKHTPEPAEKPQQQHPPRPSPPPTPSPRPTTTTTAARPAVHQDTDEPPVHKTEPTVKIPQLKTENEVKGGYGLPTKVVPPPSPRPVTPGTVPELKIGSGNQAHKGTGANNGDTNFVENQEDSVPTPSPVHWKKPKEWFPVPEESLITLPTGKPKPIPTIQFAFGQESPAAKEKREDRLAKVKAEAERAWKGYKKYAWTHDELRPVSKESKDPFCGWAATLVDTLDTLWIMGMKDEFDDAVKAVKEIDFTTTPYRSDIPVFETIIRYLGGLVAAYDVSGGHDGQYRVLLDKAVELAEILMSVFDTPNRLPILYYQWKPEFNVSPKRASTNSGVAELGSMSMEFTRLAQLTGKQKYYDAVARITNAFEELQNRPNGTAIPGIFPEQLDASGCNRSVPIAPTIDNSSDDAKKQAADDVNLQYPSKGYESRSNKYATVENSNRRIEYEDGTPYEGASAVQENGATLEKRASVGAEAESVVPHNATIRETETKSNGPHTAVASPLKADGLPAGWECAPQALTGGGWGYGGSYSMGGSQDSAYEYFPKQYLLLGGLEPKYRAMHEKTVAGVKKYLLYRPMAEGDPDILFSAKAHSSDGTADQLTYEWEITHLTCFLGGMFGLGGKIFDSPEDVEIAKKLSEGCFWAYDVMPTGIMPESSNIMPCKDPNDCHFNQTAWHEQLDPNADYRVTEMAKYYEDRAEWKKAVQEAKEQEEKQKKQFEEKDLAEAKRKHDEAERKAAEASAERARRPVTVASGEVVTDLKQKDAAVVPSKFRKRDWLDEINVVVPDKNHNAAETRSDDLETSLDLNAPTGETTTTAESHNQTPSYDDETDNQKPIYVPPEPIKPLTHEEYIADKIERERLPKGFITLHDKRYILRPEAIESVWYMYRITGDTKWQEKGWRMFEAVIKHTSTEVGHTAIADVTERKGPVQEDSMESFWLAETLKYFYLLFAEPGVVSLDEWVLNTEAHPFRRPK